MKECKSVHLSGTLEVPLPETRAFSLFTPSGESTWVEGWDPVFPAPVADEIEPGTVFETHHGDYTIWVVVRCEPGALVEYARITPGDRAGLVRVECEAASDNATFVTVSYQLTALTPEGNSALDDFAEGYGDFLEQWRQSIQKAIDAG
ncbi:MAG TPA: SRPBCC family protein [Actinomycetota bacterium]|nr:SRPBCC family protein [Actinomycetota bacterium]